MAIREYLSLTLSFEHNIVEGALAARFARAFTQLVKSASLFEPHT